MWAQFVDVGMKVNEQCPFLSLFCLILSESGHIGQTVPL